MAESNAVPDNFLNSLAEQTEALKGQGLFKKERLIAGPQQAAIKVRNNGGTTDVLNLCANNYLGTGQSPDNYRGSTQSAGRIWLWHGFSSFYLRDTDHSQRT